MGQQIKLHGGGALPFMVMLMSDRYSARAFYIPYWGIVTRVKALPRRCTSKWIPRIVRMFLHMNAISSALGFFWVMCSIGVCVQSLQSPIEIPSFAVVLQKTGTVAVSVAIGMALIRAYVSKWHAAEHMVAAAYGKDESLQFDAVSTQSTIQSSCGGRFILPLIGIMVAQSIMTEFHSLLGLATLAVGIEVMLQIDGLKQFYTWPILRWSSINLQRWVTTSAPEKRHLETGIAAMKALLAAHAQEQ